MSLSLQFWKVQLFSRQNITFVNMQWVCCYFRIFQFYFRIQYISKWASLVVQSVRRICLQFRRPEFDPWGRKISWRRKWQPTAVFLPGKSHGWRSLVGYHPWGHRVRHDLGTKSPLPCIKVTHIKKSSRGPH